MQPSDKTSLIRDIYKKEGYVFARSPQDIATEFGFDRIARLASNENPKGPSPGALKAAQSALPEMNRYPDSTNRQFIEALKIFHGEYQFAAGVGMDGVIETCIRALINPGDKVAISTPTFSFYGLSARSQGAEVINIPRNERYEIEAGSFIAGARDAKISFLCTPNNPSGTMTEISVIEEILKHINGLLFLDNAYVEFSDIDYRPLMKKYHNLIIGRTMSKVYGLAGCRVGYAFVPDWFKPYYTTASTPFTLNILSAAAATGALADTEYMKESIRHTKNWINRFRNECRKKTFPTGANFMMID